MGTCHYCGAILEVGDRFCGNCGHPTTYVNNQMNLQYEIKQEYKPKGVILTDSLRLARKFKVQQSFVLSSIHNYINEVSPYISYSLLDTYQSPSDNWQLYHQALFKDKRISLLKKMEYLFIIGSDDIIPVPLVQNCMVTNKKEFVPTDIVYGCNISYYSQNGEDINSIIRSKQFFHVGRLPLALDASFCQLQDYFNRSRNLIGKGIPVQIAYGQSDPHWKNVSMKVISDLNNKNLLPSIEAPSSVFHDKIFLSPYITCETVDKAFNKYGNLFYFNMHGSGDPEVPQFIGKSIEDEKSYFGIGPETLSITKYDNIIVTEACYGGKYIGLETDKSMLLSSMTNTTMLYLGSSVVAYGTIDAALKEGTGISSADIVAKEFIQHLMEGFSAGDSLYKARLSILNRKGKISVPDLLTIYEFCLYGDPALKAKFPNQQEIPSGSHDCLSDELNSNNLYVEEVYNEQPASDSILSLIRNRVDNSLKTLNEDIQRHLAVIGLKPRQLTSISKVRYGLVSQHMFTYKTESGETPVVIVDDHDQSKIVLMPKGSVEQSLIDAESLSIDYEDIFYSYNNRYRLIPSNEDEQPILEGNGHQIKTVYIDKRIEPKSKRQIKTFNAVLDQVYRPEMRNSNIASLSTKDCDYDFSLLINPLAILLETELRLGLKAIIKKEGSGWPSDPTLGSLVHSLMDNRRLLSKHGINGDFLSWIGNVPEYRNPASHSGGINESRFLSFYDLFIKIVSSPDFSQVLELTQNYK